MEEECHEKIRPTDSTEDFDGDRDIVEKLTNLTHLTSPQLSSLSALADALNTTEDAQKSYSTPELLSSFPDNSTSTSSSSNRDNCESRHDLVQIINMTLQFTMILPCVLGNILIILTLTRYRRLRSKSNLFLSSLAGADLLVGTPAIPLQIAITLYKTVPPGVCAFHAFFVTFSFGSSLINMMLISLDRYLAVARPFMYVERMTKTVVKRLSLSGWILMMALSIPTLVQILLLQETRTEGACDQQFVSCHYTILTAQHYAIYAIFTHCIFVIIFFSNTLLYLWVARAAIYQNRRINNEMSQFPSNSKNHSIKRHTVAIFSIFIFLWLPYMVTTPMVLIPQIDPATSKTAYSFSVTLAFLNCCLNCYVYVWHKQDFRWVIRKKIVSCRRSRQQRNTSLTATVPDVQLSTRTSFNYCSSKLASRRSDVSIVASVHNSNADTSDIRRDLEEFFVKKDSLPTIHQIQTPTSCSPSNLKESDNTSTNNQHSDSLYELGDNPIIIVAPALQD